MCYDEKANTTRQYRHDNLKIQSLPFDLTTCLYIDRTENLWIGLDGGGVAKLNLKQPLFNLFPLSEGDYPGLNDYFTKCFYEDEKGRIWFGTHTNGLNILDPNTMTVKNYRHIKGDKNSLPGNIVAGIIKDRDGNMWVGGSGGISLFNEKAGTFATIPVEGMPALYPDERNFIYKLALLANGNLLAATTFGLIRVEKQAGGNYKGFCFCNRDFLSSITADVAEMPDGIVYAAMPGIGLYKLKPSAASATGYDSLSTFFKGTDIRGITKDEKKAGCLWLGTGIGLIHFDTKTNTSRLWNDKNGLANSYVYGCLQDGADNIWLSTNNGLSFFNVEEGTFKNYTYRDGLQSNEFNTQAFYKGASGNFYFGGLKGFNWFNPSATTAQPVKPAVALTGIQIDNTAYDKTKDYLLSQTITVPYNKNDFIFKFAALDYTRPGENMFRFILQGWDHTPVTSYDGIARYTNLAPGTYHLKYKAANAAGIWSDEETITLVISPPFWKTAWFVSLVTLLCLGAIIFTTYTVSQVKAKRRLLLLEKQIAVEEERKRISADMHDEIGAGLTHIALLSELIQVTEKPQAAIKKDVQLISSTARLLVQTMSEIIWALNTQNDTLENLLAYIREQSGEYFQSLQVQFDIDFTAVTDDIKLTNAQRRNLYLVTKEALNNAVKHSGATLITLTVRLKNGCCSFTVSDNGKGMHIDANTVVGNGLKNMQKRMKDIQGTFEFTSLAQGTVVSYSLTV